MPSLPVQSTQLSTESRLWKVFYIVSPKRVGHAKLLADADSGGVLNLAMPWNGTRALGNWIKVDAMFCTLSKQQATVRFEVPNQVYTFHMVTLRRP